MGRHLSLPCSWVSDMLGLGDLLYYEQEFIIFNNVHLWAILARYTKTIWIWLLTLLYQQGCSYWATVSHIWKPNKITIYTNSLTMLLKTSAAKFPGLMMFMRFVFYILGKLWFLGGTTKWIYLFIVKYNMLIHLRLVGLWPHLPLSFRFGEINCFTIVPGTMMV